MAIYQRTRVLIAHDRSYNIDMKFGTALPHTVRPIHEAYAEFENNIEMDRNRNVVFDFNK